MIKTYFVDGDKGGVGKSFTARCLVDMFINHEKTGVGKLDQLIIVDADPMNADLCGKNGYVSAEINGVQVTTVLHPIKSDSDWIAVVDKLNGIINLKSNTRVIFSLPAAAGLYITDFVLDLMKVYNGVSVWVLSNDESSTDQLRARVDSNPYQYNKGFIVTNLRSGVRDSFKYFNYSEIRERLVNTDEFGWHEIELVPLNAMVSAAIGNQPLHLVGGEQSALGIGSKMAVNAFRSFMGIRFAKALESNDE